MVPIHLNPHYIYKIKIEDKISCFPQYVYTHTHTHTYIYIYIYILHKIIYIEFLE